jgi:hypothetical protein
MVNNHTLSIITLGEYPSLDAEIRVWQCMTLPDMLEVSVTLSAYSEAIVIVVGVLPVVEAIFARYPEESPTYSSPLLMNVTYGTGETFEIKLTDRVNILPQDE